MCALLQLALPLPTGLLGAKKFWAQIPKFLLKSVLFLKQRNKVGFHALAVGQIPGNEIKNSLFLRGFSVQSYLQINAWIIRHFEHLQNLYSLKKLAEIPRLIQQKSRFFWFFRMDYFNGIMANELVKPQFFVKKFCQIRLVRSLPVEA